MSLTTNGMLLDKEKVKYLTDNHISLILSLDGRKEMHDSMRPGVNNEGTYDRIMKNLQYCIKHRNGEEYYVRGTFTRQNLDFTTDVEDMLNHGFPRFLWNRLSAMTRRIIPSKSRICLG